mmetsp:Transcript_38202/g.122854  ORF Transcript_38202/g.122854 Transcript_38202/m.122854 type:complete len:298 (-) Transcript_38202:353-1246(-)
MWHIAQEHDVQLPLLRLEFQGGPGRSIAGDDQNGIHCAGARSTIPRLQRWKDALGALLAGKALDHQDDLRLVVLDTEALAANLLALVRVVHLRREHIVRARRDSAQILLVLLAQVVPREYQGRCGIQSAPLDRGPLSDQVVREHAEFDHRGEGHMLVREHVHLDVVGTVHRDAPPRASRKDEAANQRREEHVHDVPTVRSEEPCQLHARVVADAIFQVERVHDCRNVRVVEGGLPRSIVCRREDNDLVPLGPHVFHVGRASDGDAVRLGRQVIRDHQYPAILHWSVRLEAENPRDEA